MWHSPRVFPLWAACHPAGSLASSGLPVLVVLAGMVGGCSDAGPRPPASLAVVSGDQQTGTVGLELPDPLIVAVQDASGRPAADAPVNFSVESGDGSLRADTVMTGPDGLASNGWTLGTYPGEGRVAARLDAAHEVVFSATAVAGPTSELEPSCLPFLYSYGEEICGYHRQVGVPFFPFSHVSTFDRYGNPTDPTLDVIIVPGPGLDVTGDTVGADAPIDSHVDLIPPGPQDPSDSLLHRVRIAFLENLLDSQWRVISRCLGFAYNPAGLDSLRMEMVTDSVRYLEDSERAVWTPMKWYGTAVVDSFPRSGAPVRGTQPAVLELYQAADWFWTEVPGHWGPGRAYLRPDSSGGSFVGTLRACSVGDLFRYTYDEATLTRLR